MTHKEALEKIRDSASRRVEGADHTEFLLKWCQEIARFALEPDDRFTNAVERLATSELQSTPNTTWQPPPDDGSGLLAAAQPNNSIEAILTEPTPSPPKPEADDELLAEGQECINNLYADNCDDTARTFGKCLDRVLALQNHIADLYIERDQARAELASVRERTIEEIEAYSWTLPETLRTVDCDDAVSTVLEALVAHLRDRALKSPTGET